MAIPRSDPYVPQDINPSGQAPGPSVNPVGSAIAGIGVGVTNSLIRLREEKQASTDRLAAIEFKNQSKLADMEYQAAIANANTEEDIEKATAARNSALDGFLHGRELNKDVRSGILAESDFFRKQSAILGEISRAKLQSRKERAATEESALSLASAGDLEGATETISESPAYDEAEKIRIIGQLNRQFDAVTKEQYSNKIRSTRSVEDLDVLAESLDQTQAGEVTKEKIKKAIETRKDTVRREDFSMLGSEISLQSNIVSRIERGEFFTDEEIEALNVDEPTKKLIKETGEQLQGGLNQYTPEYKGAIEFINNEFAKDPLWSIGKGEISSEQLSKIYNRIDKGPWDTSAKFGLLSHLMGLRAVDAKVDKDLWGFFDTVETASGTVRVVGDREISIDDGQERMLKQASLDMSAILERSNGRIVAEKTGMTLTDYTELFFDLQSEETIAEFEGLDPNSKEFEDRYRSVVSKKITDKRKKTAIQQLRDKILGLRVEQSRIRGEIAGGQ